jgi:hypothetical protein
MSLWYELLLHPTGIGGPAFQLLQETCCNCMGFLPVSLSNGEQVQPGAGSCLTTGIQPVYAQGREQWSQYLGSEAVALRGKVGFNAHGSKQGDQYF